MSRQRRRDVLKSAGAMSVLSLTGLSGCLSGGGDGSSGSTNNSNSTSSEGGFPNGDVQMIVPYAAGGGTDRTARQLATLASENSDTSFYVSNVTGGSGSAGFRRAANANPDGTTIGILTVEISTLSHLGITDVTPDDFAPLAQYNFDPASLTVRQDAPYEDVNQLVDFIRNENDGQFQFSNSGTGAIWHLSAAQFAQAAGISDQVQHIAYEGGSPAAQAVASSEVGGTATSAPEVASLVQDGPLSVVGVMGENRVSTFPDVPTLQQQGMDVNIGAWRGLGVPSQTPQSTVQALSSLFEGIYNSSEFEQFMNNNGFGMVYRNPDQFGQFMSTEYDRFGNLINSLNISQ